jgi:choline dehydrogenase-like flavoprotein
MSRIGWLRGVRRRNASAWLLPHQNSGEVFPMQLRDRLRRFEDDDEVDIVIVGCGAGGGVLTQRLARLGWRVVCLEAGPFWNPTHDWVSDEAGSRHLYWTEPRVISGDDPVPLGSNNSGRGVGGSMVHFAGYVPRFHPSDFRTRSSDGVGADWPIAYEQLARAPRRSTSSRPTSRAAAASPNGCAWPPWPPDTACACRLTPPSR